MGMYEFIVGIGTLLFLALLFGLLLGPFDEVSTTFSGMSTDADNQALYSNNAKLFYFSFFFIAICVFGWILKSSMKKDNGLDYE